MKYLFVVGGLSLVAYLLYRGLAWSFLDPTPPYKILFDRKSRVRWDHERWVEDDEPERRRNAFGAMGKSG